MTPMVAAGVLTRVRITARRAGPGFCQDGDMTAHIVAMGGGGFSMSPFGAPTNLDRYLVELTGKPSPLVCFAPTASADDPQYINKFLLAYGTLGVRTMVLTLWEGGSAGSVARLADADLLLVGGGHTVNLMALWQAHGVDAAIRSRYAVGDVVTTLTGFQEYVVVRDDLFCTPVAPGLSQLAAMCRSLAMLMAV